MAQTHPEPLKSSGHRSSLRGLPLSLVVSKESRDLFDVANYASYHAKSIGEGSEFMEQDAQQCLPTFGTEEIAVGELLGRGGYNLIFSLDAISLKDDLVHGSGKEGQLQRLAFATIVNHDKRNHQYVVKFLKPELTTKKLRSGALDLVLEAKMLASMQHENIISLRGLSENSVAGLAQGTTGYFLVLDRLQETLLQRINGWKKGHQYKPLRQMFTRKKVMNACVKDGSCFWERFHVAVDLAAPLVYLHSKLNVVYRDLKPENVGFDRDGTLKLFDFGLAKELTKYERVSESSTLYRVGSFGGTHPYLAPEMARSEPYGLSADTHSFAIIVFEILAMREPFEDLMQQEYADQVIYGDRRPRFPRCLIGCPNWSAELRELLSQCWNSNPEARPTMEEVHSRLQTIQYSCTKV